jgi:hypothetical protein
LPFPFDFEIITNLNKFSDMRQKLFFLMLTLFMLSVASVQAQVTIGADAPPHSSAVLDLQSTALGLKLPTIELGDVADFQLLGTEDEADGIMIYNSSEETIGGNGKGIYVWNGSKWNFAGKSGQIVPADIPVTKINITSAGYVTELKASGIGNTLQLTATVEPAEASQEVIWSKVYSSATTAGDVTIDATGLVTGVKTGTVTVRATATDGSGVYRDLALIVKPSSVVTGISISPINGTSTIEVGKSLQLEATVEPITAYSTVIWSTSDDDVASVTSGGLVSTVQAGSTTIMATASDGSNVIGNYDIEVIPSTIPPLATTPVVIAGTTYQTWDFNGTVWTVENMRHGTPWAQYYDGDQSKPNCYYTASAGSGICTDGFTLPTYNQYVLLYGYLSSSISTESEQVAWFQPSSMPGYSATNDQQWVGWGTQGPYWIEGMETCTWQTRAPQKFGTSSVRVYSIRCVAVQ